MRHLVTILDDLRDNAVSHLLQINLVKLQSKLDFPLTKLPPLKVFTQHFEATLRQLPLSIIKATELLHAINIRFQISYGF